MKKRILSMLLAATLLITFSIASPAITASAAPGNDDLVVVEEIHIKVPGADLTDMDISYYKIYDVTASIDGTAYSYLLTANFADLPKYVKDNVDDFFTSDQKTTNLVNLSNYDDPYEGDQYFLRDIENFGDHSELAYGLARAVDAYAKLHNLTSGVATYHTNFDGTPYALIDLKGDPKAGYYLIVGSVKTAEDIGNDGNAGRVYTAAILYTNYVKFAETLPPNPSVICRYVEITMKLDVPTIDKHISYLDFTEENPSGVSTWGDDLWTKYGDSPIGATRVFRLTGTIPARTGYKSYTYIMHDELSGGLTLDPASFVVYAGTAHFDGVGDGFGGATVPKTVITNEVEIYISRDNVNWSLTTASNANDYVADPGNPQYIKLVYTEAAFGHTFQYGERYFPYTHFYATYNALVNEKAIVSGTGEDGNAEKEGNINEAWLEYSNNPYDFSSTNKTPRARVTVYTFPMNIFKYTNGDNGVPKAVPNTEFQLYFAFNGTDNYDFDQDDLARYRIVDFQMVNDPTSKWDGYYQVNMRIDRIPANLTQTLVSDEFGMIRIAGLKSGVYYLVETEAADGYNPLEHAIRIEVKANYDTTQAPRYLVNVDYTLVGYDKPAGKWVPGANPIIAQPTPERPVATFDIFNSTGSRLPDTGGIGTTIFTVIGSILMLAAASFLLMRKRFQGTKASVPQK